MGDHLLPPGRSGAGAPRLQANLFPLSLSGEKANKNALVPSHDLESPPAPCLTERGGQGRHPDHPFCCAL
jgi:hypothetical protein